MKSLITQASIAISALFSSVGAISASTTSCSQSPTGYKVKNLTYFDDSEGDLPCMYAGNMQASENLVDGEYNTFFFWYFPNPDSDDMPLIIYMNGGPGATSMTALFEENGPLTCKQDDEDDQDSYRIIYSENHSWQFLGDLLYIDQPIGTGWAYGNEYPTDMNEVADQFLNWLLNFYEEFPAAKSKQLVLTGESFAGKFLSYIAQAILDYNEGVSSSNQIDLQNLIVSDPIVVNEVQRMNQHLYGYATGLYDDSQTAQVEVLRRRCEENIYNESINADTRDGYCQDILSYFADPSHISHFDARNFVKDHIPPKTYGDMFTTSTQLDQLKSDLHINKTGEFVEKDSTIGNYITDRVENAAWLYSSLLERGMRIVINVGEFDMMEGARQTIEMVKQIELVGNDADEFWTQARSVYKWLDPLNNDKWQYGGFFRESTNFTFIMVPQAGHMVSLDQRQANGMMVSDLLNYGKLRCPTNVKCTTFANDMCDYLNDCSGQGSCSASTEGQCVCNTGYYGADCSVDPLGMSVSKSGSYSTDLTKWYFFKTSAEVGQTSFELLLSSEDTTFDVYIKFGSDTIPDPNDFDLLMKSQSSVTLNESTFDGSNGFMVGVYIKRSSGSKTVTLDYQMTI